MKHIVRLFGVALAALVMSAGAGMTQGWPNQRVTIVVPFGAGSVTDILARIFADDMKNRWGQQVVVENKPGIAGTAFVAKATNDGYTLMVTSNGHTVTTLVSKNAGFDPVKDFAGITRLGAPPLFLISHPGNGAKKLADIIKMAKEKPGKMNFSSAGLASTTGIAGMLFRKAAGIDVQHVPYKSAPDAVTAVIRGDADFYFVPVNLAKELAESGKVTAIAAATAQRIPDMPNIPTMTEEGLPFVYDSWFGLLAPAGVPKEVRDRIANDWAASLKTPEMQARFKAQYTIPSSDRPEALDKIIASEVAKLTDVFKDANISQ
jgi:tripartite-type tricarboxylate transporter receptor subunit TctC